jgi:hypothetical protein
MEAELRELLRLLRVLVLDVEEGAT